MFVHGGVRAAQLAVAKMLIEDQVLSSKDQDLLALLDRCQDLTYRAQLQDGIVNIGIQNRFFMANEISDELAKRGFYETGTNVPSRHEEPIGMPCRRIGIYPLGDDLATCSFRMDFGAATEALAKQQELIFGLNRSINVNVEVFAQDGRLTVDLAKLASHLPLQHTLVLSNLNEAAQSIIGKRRSGGQFKQGLLVKSIGNHDLAIRLTVDGLSNITAAGQVISGDQSPGKIPTLTFALHNLTIQRDGIEYGYILETQEQDALAYAKAIADAFEAMTVSAQVTEDLMQDTIPITPEAMVSQPIHPSILKSATKLREMFMAIWNAYGSENDQQANAKLREILSIWEERGYIDPELTDIYETYKLVSETISRVVHNLYPTKTEAIYHFQVARYLTLVQTLELFKNSPNTILDDVSALLPCLFKTTEEIENTHPELINLKAYIDAHPTLLKEKINTYGPALLASIEASQKEQNPLDPNADIHAFNSWQYMFHNTWKFLLGDHSNAYASIDYLRFDNIAAGEIIFPLWITHLREVMLEPNRETLSAEIIQKLEDLIDRLEG